MAGARLSKEKKTFVLNKVNRIYFLNKKGFKNQMFNTPVWMGLKCVDVEILLNFGSCFQTFQGGV